MGEALLLGLASGGSAVAGVALKAAFDWLNEKTRANAPAAKLAAEAQVATAQAAFTQALTAQAEAFMERLQEDRRHLEDKVSSLEAKVADLEAENERCVGEGRQMAQRVDSLEAHLRRHGVPLPERALATGLIELAGGKTTVLMATTERPRPRPQRRRKPRKETT